MSNLLELQVYWKDTIVSLWLTPEEHETAIKDEQFLLSLLQERDVSSLNETDISLLSDKDISSQSIQEKEDTSKYVWTDAGVLLLLDLYKSREDAFSNGKKRHNKIWTEIAEAMKLHNYNVTGTQCSMKVAGLKRTYKQIKDNNKKSGNGRSTWGLYSAVDSVFSKKAWVEPKYLASSDSLSPSDNVCSEDATPPNPKKRKVERIIENYMQEVKDEKVAEQAEKAKKEEAREKLKTERYDERKEDRKVMHEEKMSIMKEMIQVLKNLSHEK